MRMSEILPKLLPSLGTGGAMGSSRSSQQTRETWPPAVRGQLRELQRGLLAALGEGLVGIYLHGSLALGGFNPEQSDLDLLAVTEGPLTAESKRRLIEVLLRLSGKPRPIEISFLGRGDLRPWRHPTPYQLHYGENWRSRYEELLDTEARWEQSEQQPTDPDLAAHITVLRERGVRLQGRPIREVFPEVPRADYIDSIVQDFYWAKERLGEDPVYFVLNACRVYAYLKEGRILSKVEAGAWALRTVPERWREILATALEIYRGDREEAEFDPASLARLAAYMERRVKLLIA